MWDRGAETERGRGEEDGGGLEGGAAEPFTFILQQINDHLDEQLHVPRQEVWKLDMEKLP